MPKKLHFFMGDRGACEIGTQKHPINDGAFNRIWRC